VKIKKIYLFYIVVAILVGIYLSYSIWSIVPFIYFTGIVGIVLLWRILSGILKSNTGWKYAAGLLRLACISLLTFFALLTYDGYRWRSRTQDVISRISRYQSDNGSLPLNLQQIGLTEEIFHYFPDSSSKNYVLKFLGRFGFPTTYNSRDLT
jgi:asparagine N-glycosylation enzyme membrane subunit Stt3